MAEKARTDETAAAEEKAAAVREEMEASQSDREEFGESDGDGEEGFERRRTPFTFTEAVRLAGESVRSVFRPDGWSEGVSITERVGWTWAILGQLTRSQLRCRRGRHNWIPEYMVGGVLETVACTDCEMSITPKEWFELA